MNYRTIDIRYQGPVCFIKLNRPEANNAINDLLIHEFQHILEHCEMNCSVVVLEGSPQVFCIGADFQAMNDMQYEKNALKSAPELLYDVWLKLATGPFITIANVKGKANAGGVGFVAACDIVLADDTASFGLSELLFGLFPACVLPFLIRKVGFQKAHYLILTTKPVSAEIAYNYGLVDSYEANTEALLRTHLIRFSRLPKNAVAKYKRYMTELNDVLMHAKPLAIEANREIFSDIKNIQSISDYIEKGKFPWERKIDL
jgi:polyketide biosynthesis enoyl-CoA hydratase PksH